MSDKFGEWSSARPGSLLSKDHHITHYYTTVPAEMPIETLTRPDFWAHVARIMQRHMRITVDAEDLSWTAELVVTDVSRVSASVAILSHVDIVSSALDHSGPGPGYMAKWGGPVRRWRIIRTSDSEVIKEELPSRDAAEQWIKNKAKAEAA